MKQAKYDTIVRRFLDEEHGAVVYLSDDASFTRVLRNIFSRDVGVKRDVIYQFTSPVEAMKQCGKLTEASVPCIFFIERLLNERPTTDTLLSMKNQMPEVKIILLTWEATKETVAYFFELGVSRVLVKPVSANKLIQDMAHALNPPGSLKKQTARCKELLKNGDYDEALELSDRLLLVKPNSGKALTMRGDALLGIGEVDKAIRCYLTAHEARPIYMAPLIKLATTFRDMEDERALEYLQILDQISPLNPERKVEIAEQYLLRNEAEEAEVYLDKSMAVAEREISSRVGDLTMRIVDAVFSVAPQLAIKYLYRVIESKRFLGLDDLIHFNRLGMILRGEGKWREAIAVYEMALTITSEDPAIHYNMGLAYWEGSERTKALNAFEHALKVDPLFFSGSIGATLNIGLLYFDLRHYRDAEPFFQHVLSLDPENMIAQKRMKTVQKRLAA